MMIGPLYFSVRMLNCFPSAQSRQKIGQSNGPILIVPASSHPPLSKSSLSLHSFCHAPAAPPLFHRGLTTMMVRPFFSMVNSVVGTALFLQNLRSPSHSGIGP